PDVFARRPPHSELGEPVDWRELLSPPEEPEPVESHPPPGRRWLRRTIAPFVALLAPARVAYRSLPPAETAPLLLPEEGKTATPRPARYAPPVVNEVNEVEGTRHVVQAPRGVKYRPTVHAVKKSSVKRVQRRVQPAPLPAKPTPRPRTTAPVLSWSPQPN